MKLKWKFLFPRQAINGQIRLEAVHQGFRIHTNLYLPAYMTFVNFVYDYANVYAALGKRNMRSLGLIVWNGFLLPVY